MGGSVALVHPPRTRQQPRTPAIDHHYRVFNSNGLVSWIVATVIGLIMLQLGSFDPALAGIGATWGPICTAASAGIIYAILWGANPRSRTGLCGR